MDVWWKKAIVYHLYPFGFCGAPQRNDFSSPPADSLSAIADCADGIRELGCDTLLLGPVFESTSHGYDTVDWWHIDRRLGTNEQFAALVEQLHAKGIKVVLDGVFHHVGRDFWAFYELRTKGAACPYKDWFSGVDFSVPGQRNDGFAYGNWEGHDELVKLNLNNPDLKEHLFGAVRQMIEAFGIDGLRLDVAYALDKTFMKELSEFCRGIRPEFWLLGEVIHDDYAAYMKNGLLGSVTDYEVYKALWSSIVDRNYFELSWACSRQFGSDAGEHDGALFNFGDNHDVMRLASRLKDRRELRMAYGMLWMLPGIPSVYYGSELGMKGEKQGHDDWALRPPKEGLKNEDPELAGYIARLSQLRRSYPVIGNGGFEELFVSNETYGFARSTGNGGAEAISMFNLGEKSVPMEELCQAAAAKLTGTEAAGQCPAKALMIDESTNRIVTFPTAGADARLPAKSWMLLVRD